MPANYIDNQVPYGAFAADLKSGPQLTATTVIAAAVFENFTPNRPSNKINRPNEIGGPNGFAIVATQETGSGTIQWPTTATTSPKIGHWFQYTFDGANGAAAETWVITDTSEPREMNGYFKSNITCQLAHTPPQ
jgi:hypothetical protein